MIPIILLVMGLVYAVFLIYRANELKEAASLGQSLLMITLVLIKAAYASSTDRQANASVEMAEEMRDTRYDALRPIIDFRFRDSEERSGGALGIGAKGEVPSELHGQLCNIGVGPATDVYSFVYLPSGKRRRRSFDTIVVGKEIGPERLSLAQTAPGRGHPVPP